MEDPSSRIDELLLLLGVSHSREDLVKDTFECFPVVCTEIFSKSEWTTERTSAIAELFMLLADICSAKELLLTLFMQMDTFKEDSLYQTLLPVINRCIRKLPCKQHLSLGNALEIVSAHLETIPIAEESTECVEFVQSMSASLENRLVSNMSALLNFIEPFASDVSAKSVMLCSTVSDDAEKQRRDITRCLLKVLGNISCKINLTPSCAKSDNETVTRTACFSCTARCVQLLISLHSDSVRLLTNIVTENAFIVERQQQLNQPRNGTQGASHPDDVGDEEFYSINVQFSESGASVLAYMVFGENFLRESVPQVYGHQYLFLWNIGHIIGLLTGGRSSTVMKGVKLCYSLLELIDAGSLAADLFELPEVIDLIRTVVKAMTSTYVKQVCQQLVRLVPFLLKSFSLGGRIRMLEFLLGDKGPSIQALAISLLKDEIDEMLCDTVSQSFGAKILLDKLRYKIFCVPKDGFAARLLTDDKDRIMAVLNLLRYLIIRDKPSSNQTGIWTTMDSLEKEFLEQLDIGINRAQNDVHAEKNNIEWQKENPNSTISKQQSETDVTLTVSDKNVDSLSVEQQLEAVNMALVSLDMIRSVHLRVCECIHVERPRFGISK